MGERYPLLMPATGFAAGLLLARIDSISFSVVAVAAVLSVLPVLAGLKRSLFIALLAGLCWGTASLFADGWRAAADASWVGRRIEITGTVERAEQEQIRSRLRLAGVMRSDGAALPGFVDLYLYGEQNAQKLLPGQRVRLLAKLHYPANHRNPGAFDFEQYCFDRHIALVGGASSSVEVIDPAVSRMEQVRQRVRQLLQPIPAGQQGVLLALLLADRSRITVNVEEQFAASGAAHLLAISGLHIGMVAGWFFVIAWWLLTRREVWIIHLPVRTIALIGGVLAAALYAAFAGWPLPTQRAVLMAVAGAVAWSLRRRNRPLNTLAAALILILVLDPGAIISVSLWLSFAAVAALLLWPSATPKTGRNHWLAWLNGLFWVSLVASLATLPVIAWVFGRIPTYSLIANLIAVPFYGLWILPLALAGAVMAVVGMDLIAGKLFGWAAMGIDVCQGVLAEIHQWPAGNLWIPEFPVAISLLYGGGLLFAIRLWQRKQTIGLSVAAMTVALFLLWVVPERAPESPQLHVWDVGQGASASLMMPDGSLMMIDAPGRYGSRFNGGTLAAAGLRHAGMVHADVLVLTHAQSDHAGGAVRLLDHLRNVNELWLADVPANREYQTMQSVAQRIRAQGGKVLWIKQGDRLQLAGLSVDVLWPPKGYEPSNGNNASLVLSAELDGRRILLPGDAEGIVEAELVAQGIGVHDVMLMPHHGSRTSSSEHFVKRVRPGYAIAQAGRYNRYGFPDEEVVKRYQQTGAKVLRTGEGAIVIEFNRNGMSIDQFETVNTGKRALALQWARRPI